MNTSNTLPNFTQYGYQVIRELGHNLGGLRFTYLAVNQTSGQQVVIKEFCFGQRGSSWAGYHAHNREIQILQHLNHPCIPRYLDSFETDYGFCLVQEYKDASSLAHNNDFNPEEIKKIAISVLEILTDLQSLKEPVFHRDIKPENILVDRDLNVYLIDFSVAQIVSNSGEVSTCTAGTFGFMPHEQVVNQTLTLTKASDFYSLGATLICLLTKTPSSEIGRLSSPKSGFILGREILSLHPDFVRWLKRMVAPDITERFPDAKTALDKLKSIQIEGLSLREKLGNGIKRTSKVLFQKRVIYPVVEVVLLGGLGWGLHIERQEIAKQQQIEAQKLLDDEKQQKKRNLDDEKQQKKRNQTAQRLVVNRKCVRCDLRNVYLSSTKLQGVKLQDANLEGADLKGANLKRANLQEINSTDKYSSSTNFDKVNLEGTSLEGANLRGASLEGANLEGANLEGADLYFTDFSNANLKGANLKNANLRYTNFSGANLKGANLEGTDLKYTQLEGTNLKNAIMPDGSKYEEWMKQK